MLNAVNISLTGMPGAGKSTIGVLLAKAVSWSFLDTDVMIQVAEERLLQDIIQAEGIERFVRIEQRHVLALDRRKHVIATGGSAVYSEAAMEHLKSDGVIVHLDLPLEQIEKRVTNLSTRGVVIEPGETLSSLYEKRQPLYEKYADVSIDCSALSIDGALSKLLSELSL